ncbi:MAG: aminotransferase class III-fold pyridoxal phosphate-dependent enzyme [Desulfobacteraceae bacterium]|nr:aminotransferase class III-fold pyridoxal phosphate-dependent enzyme [Desulfobacteraceae bacterium]
MSSIVAHAPEFSETRARDIANDIFGIDGPAKALPSERDQNFQITGANGAAYVLKIANAGESVEVLRCQNLAMDHINGKKPVFSWPVTCCPQVCRALNGEEIVPATGDDGNTYQTRMLTWVDGKPLAAAKPHDSRLMANLGHFFGRLDQALADFRHPAAHRDFYWDLQNAGKVVSRKAHLIDDRDGRQLVDGFLDRYTTHVAGRLDNLRKGVIHNDGNDNNVLVSFGSRWSLHIEGVIDFGDMVHTHVINELAITCAYAMMGKADPLSTARHIVAGYHQENPLGSDEVEVLFDLICMRLCVSVCNAVEQFRCAPENKYLTISEKPAWDLLARLKQVHPRYARYVFREACGMDPVPESPRITSWLMRHQSDFSSITGRPLTPENCHVFDLSVNSPLITAGPELKNPALLTGRLFREMSAAHTDVGIGQYDEARIGYVSDQYAVTSNELPRRRTIHLGIDLFMAEGSPVHAFHDGIVHSTANNAEPLDYGPTIILSHETGEGDLFHTLYGHLCEDSLENIGTGMHIRAGDVFARVGSPAVNGGSPPHVHFQIITDMIGNAGNFAGVARADLRGVWNSISPDPDCILGIGDKGPVAATPDSAAIIRVRQRHLGKSLSVSYDQPLNIIRGVAQYLYSDTGQAYLDGVNNVSHVGHCHPHVVAAGQRQMAVLNTNTRYLHNNITRYAERLLSKFPDPLNVCFFVCTGSEANELALRMARTYTDARDIIMIDGAYHGNTQALIDISPYKHDGPGGKGPPPWAHKVTMPCAFRGPYKGMGEKTGGRYADTVGDTVRHIKEKGGRVAAFICESMLGCGGQVILPENYLAAAFEKVRAAGGVCVADEVQVGFGRVGTHFWAFETQSVVPDIVTLGKPIGNGHPLAAVVTTPAIAAAFNNGMEYFNTFGGNPVSCAIGMSVLDVIETENLQENARTVGCYMLERLETLKDKYPLVGDVRGLGLYAGVELVTNRETLDPAAEHAAYIINRMKAYGILLSTDGPLHNILKFKPPLVFTHENADMVVSALDKILGEDALQI